VCQTHLDFWIPTFNSYSHRTFCRSLGAYHFSGRACQTTRNFTMVPGMLSPLKGTSDNSRLSAFSIHYAFQISRVILPSKMWTVLTPHVSHTEPAIWHAMLAFALLYEETETRGPTNGWISTKRLCWIDILTASFCNQSLFRSFARASAVTQLRDNISNLCSTLFLFICLEDWEDVTKQR